MAGQLHEKNGQKIEGTTKKNHIIYLKEKVRQGRTVVTGNASRTFRYIRTKFKMADR